MDSALILFAHGSRDPAWAQSFERVLAAVVEQAPQRAPMLAYLELMSPDLTAAVEQQRARGFRSVRVVPLFLGLGGHLRRDLPALLDAAKRAHPGVAIELAAPAGDAPDVLAALAAHCLA